MLPVATARTGTYGTSMNVSPAPTVLAVQLPCVIWNDPCWTWTIAGPGWMCQPESKSFAAVFTTRMCRFVPSDMTVCEVAAEMPTAARTAAARTAPQRTRSFFERRTRMITLLFLVVAWPGSRSAVPFGQTLGRDSTAAHGGRRPFDSALARRSAGMLAPLTPGLRSRTTLFQDREQGGPMVDEARRSLDDLRSELDELRVSRARAVAAADAERRRIERDLHDGVQQHLVALAVNRQLALQLADTDSAAAKALLEEMSADVREALDGVRELAEGIYPPLLLDRGLTDALKGAARRAAIPVRVEAAALARHSPGVE